ncbi:MAG: hypothetical protein JOS17DRAFT_745426, partial [Linnemannia elongata]
MRHWLSLLLCFFLLEHCWLKCLYGPTDWRKNTTDRSETKTLCTVQHSQSATSSFGYCSLDLKRVSQEARPIHTMTDISLPFLSLSLCFASQNKV